MSAKGAEVDGRCRLKMVSDRWSRPDLMGVAWATVLILSQVGQDGRAGSSEIGEEGGAVDVGNGAEVDCRCCLKMVSDR